MLKRGSKKRNMKIEPMTTAKENKLAVVCVALLWRLHSCFSSKTVAYLCLVSRFRFHFTQVIYNQCVWQNTTAERIVLVLYFCQILCNKLCPTYHGRDFWLISARDIFRLLRKSLAVTFQLNFTAIYFEKAFLPSSQLWLSSTSPVLTSLSQKQFSNLLSSPLIVCFARYTGQTDYCGSYIYRHTPF